jgi:Ring finger domain
MTLYYQHIGDMEEQYIEFTVSKNVAFPLLSVYLTVGIVGGIVLCIVVMCVIVKIRNMRVVANNARMLQQRQNRIPKKQEFLPNADKQMKTIIYSYSKSKYGEKYCTICLVEFKAAEKIQEILVCSHIFHIDCIKQWINSKSKHSVLCPNCNKSIIP